MRFLTSKIASTRSIKTSTAKMVKTPLRASNCFHGMRAFQVTSKRKTYLNSRTQLNKITFLQFPLNDALAHITQPRWFLDLNLNFDINKHLSMVLHYDQNIDYYRPLPIDTYFYNLNLGFQLKW
jgi:hypothetical protein